MSDPAVLLKRVRAILLAEWDPIGVADEPAAQDEYDSYAPGVVTLLADHATGRVLADHLLNIERERMGLAGNKATAEKAANAILALVRH